MCFPHLREDVLMTYRLIQLIVTLAMSLVTVPCATDAQPARKCFHIGRLFPGTAAFAPARLEPFRQGLREIGYIEGQHYVLESRAAEGQPDRLPDLAADLVRLPADVIVVAATGAAKAAKNATSTTPIVMIDPGDPVSAGLVANLAQPGGNITGLSSVTPDLIANNLQLLKNAVPELPNVAFLWNVATSTGAQALQEMQKATQRLGIQLHSMEVRGPDDFKTAFTMMTSAQITALLVFPDPLTFSH